jgi:hypothetical protein
MRLPIALAAALAAAPAAADDFMPAIQSYLETEIAPWAGDPRLAEAVLAQNAVTAGYTQADIDRLDQDLARRGRHRRQRAHPRRPRPSRLRPPARAGGGVGRRDHRGLRDGRPRPQRGLERAHLRLLAGGRGEVHRNLPGRPGRVHISEIEFDESTQTYQAQVSLPSPIPRPATVDRRDDGRAQRRPPVLTPRATRERRRPHVPAPSGRLRRVRFSIFLRCALVVAVSTAVVAAALTVLELPPHDRARAGRPARQGGGGDALDRGPGRRRHPLRPDRGGGGGTRAALRRRRRCGRRRARLDRGRHAAPRGGSQAAGQAPELAPLSAEAVATGRTATPRTASSSPNPGRLRRGRRGRRRRRRGLVARPRPRGRSPRRSCGSLALAAASSLLVLAGGVLYLQAQRHPAAPARRARDEDGRGGDYDIDPRDRAPATRSA